LEIIPSLHVQDAFLPIVPGPWFATKDRIQAVNYGLNWFLFWPTNVGRHAAKNHLHSEPMIV
jgi:hypothetical protein